jgi:serine/threonine-protein kinase RsbW
MSRTYKLDIVSEPEKIVEVDAFAEKPIEQMGFSQDQRDDIAIALSEAVNNAIEHGNQGDPSKKVHIELEEIDNGIRIVVTDEGGGFDPSEVEDPTDPENLLAESGRGLLIIRHLMDEVNVASSGSGTRVEMIKRFSSPAL